MAHLPSSARIFHKNDTRQHLHRRADECILIPLRRAKRRGTRPKRFQRSGAFFLHVFSIDKIGNPSKIVSEPRPYHRNAATTNWQRLSGFWTAPQGEVLGGAENFHTSIQNRAQITPLGAMPHDAIAAIHHDAVNFTGATGLL